ncbi:MAG: Zn-ribbon domain-containing OB-fold protein [Caldilineae bacterium]|nr:MAG: Zn-ribbon domain-containing OB-fold protein [Caldilineae bacterium]
MPTKPIPPIDPWTEPHWAAAREGKLLIQHCRACGRHIFYPRLACPYCAAAEPDWVEASGRGRVYTFTVVHNNAPSPFLDDMPFVIAVVELEEGVRMMTNLVGCAPEAITCGMPVQVTFEKQTEAITLPKFTPLSQ